MDSPLSVNHNMQYTIQMLTKDNIRMNKYFIESLAMQYIAT